MRSLPTCILHHCPDPLAAIREMVRILRPAGRLVITDMDAHTHEWLKTEMADLWLGFERKPDPRLVRAGGVGQCHRGLHRRILPVRLRKRGGEHADISIFVAAGNQTGAHARIGAGQLRRPRSFRVAVCRLRRFKLLFSGCDKARRHRHGRMEQQLLLG